MFKEMSLNLPEPIQMQIIKMETGIGKGIARYCFTQKEIKREIWDILCEIDEKEYSNLVDKRRKIRTELKKDLESLQKLGIFIEYDIVYFDNPFFKREEKVVYINNNSRLLQRIGNKFSQRIQNPIQNIRI